MCKHSYGLFQHSFNHSHIQSLLNFFFPLGVQFLIDDFLHINTEKWQQLQYPFTRKVVQDRLQRFTGVEVDHKLTNLIRSS